MFFTNNRDHEATPPDPRGLYWGIRLGDIKWRMEDQFWAFESEQSREKLGMRTPEKPIEPTDPLNDLTLEIAALVRFRYRDQVTSQDIYDAVLT
jgi:hypothetical protein